MRMNNHKDDFSGRTPPELAINPVHAGVELAIHEHRLPPGTRLAESDLTEIYGVSRTIVRSGLQSLAHMHLVTLRPNRGASVAEPSHREAREVFEARELLEPRTARNAALKATKSDIEDLLRHTEEEHRAVREDAYGRALRLSGLFHVKIARIADQQTITEFVESLVSRSSLIIALYWSRASARCDGHSHHALIEAIAKNDQDQAEQIMRSHLVDIHSALRFEPPNSENRNLRDMLSAS